MTNTENGAVWHVEAVHKQFRRRVALSDINLDVGHGVTGLLGPNGAGKTTLLRILATTLSPSAGTLRILGQDPTHEAARFELRRSLGYLPQETRMYGEFTAFDFVDYVAILKEMTDAQRRRDEVRRVLTAVGLEDRMHSKIRTLSGGMRRSVMLAQALLGTPEMLILDEPTDGLDPAQRVRFEDLVATLAATRAVLMSTQLNEDIATVCAQVIVLDHGRIRFAGSPAELACVADGRVWESEDRDPAAILSRLTSNGRFRNLGSAPPRADALAPSVEDGYLLLTNSVTSDVLT